MKCRIGTERKKIQRRWKFKKDQLSDIRGCKVGYLHLKIN